MPASHQRNDAAARFGSATVELAILLPFLCFAFILAIDYGRVFYYSLTVENCARSGASYGSQDTTSALDQSGIQAVAQRDASNLDLTNLKVTSSTDNSANPTTVTVTASYTFTTVTRYPGIPSQTTLSRTVQMNVVPATPKFN
jgi:Flp pilus assembly protein TadG